ncbi:MAG: alpha-ketoglutarate-dependent dioxygenase AlkB [Gammaproteobacteria bacterium]
MPHTLATDWLDETAQAKLLQAINEVLREAPLYTPHMPRTGRPMSVKMTNCGPLGWYTDQACGYRYITQHPLTQRPWPAMPQEVQDLWWHMTDYPHPPEACLINYYQAGSRMGLHRDADESATAAPVVSLSLGDTALFRVGGPKRHDPTRSFRLHSGTLIMLDGESRHWHHGVDRIFPGSSPLLPGGGRFNLTLRRVNQPN